jgi:hypothetical protein
MRHHTKDKGDAGLGFVIASLLGQGIQVALPLSEHLPFDCIAINEEGHLKRLSVKYRAAKEGVIEVSKRSSWADKNGTHIRHHQTGDYDAFAIYCPDTRQCYFVRTEEFDKFLCLRVDGKSYSNGKKAQDYVDASRLF